MYQEFYGLKENPFSLTPDPKYLYFTARHQEALAQLYYGITERKGIVAMIGEVGTGKTLLLNKLMETLHEQEMLFAYVFNPTMTPNDLFEYIAADFGLDCSSASKSQFLMRLNNLLIERYRENKTTVLIIDEAQNLTFDVLEELRLLTNLETAREKLLQIVLSGQPELSLKLDHQSVRQLKQRISLRCRLKPLTLDEVRDYITSRLKIAGYAGEGLFDARAIEKIYELSGGVPRIINNVCDNALISGFSYGRSKVELQLIEEVAEELQLTPMNPVRITPAFVQATAVPLPAPQQAVAMPLTRLAQFFNFLANLQLPEAARRFTRLLLRGRGTRANGVSTSEG